MLCVAAKNPLPARGKQIVSSVSGRSCSEDFLVLRSVWSVHAVSQYVLASSASTHGGEGSSQIEAAVLACLCLCLTRSTCGTECNNHWTGFANLRLRQFTAGLIWVYPHSGLCFPAPLTSLESSGARHFALYLSEC